MFTDTGDLGSRIAQSSSLLLTNVNFDHIVTVWGKCKNLLRFHFVLTSDKASGEPVSLLRSFHIKTSP
jgi:hypothetical protein